MDCCVLIFLEVLNDIVELFFVILELSRLIKCTVLKIELPNILYIDGRSFFCKNIGKVRVVNEEMRQARLHRIDRYGTLLASKYHIDLFSLHLDSSFFIVITPVHEGALHCRNDRVFVARHVNVLTIHSSQRICPTLI